MATVRVELLAADHDGTAAGSSPHVAVVTLDDPRRRNMLSGPMVSELVAAFDALEADTSVGAIVITGAPPAFCAGADLSGLSAASGLSVAPGGDAGADGDADALAASALYAIYEGFLRVSRCSLPTVAAVNGPAVGAGMNLALACDVRVMGGSGRMDCRFLELGLHPGGGHTWMLSRIVGPETAAAMVLFGQVVSGEEAVERGLAWRCLEDADLLGGAVQLASVAASAPRELEQRVKETLGAIGQLGDHRAAVDFELEAQIWSLSQTFFAERLAALRQRISGGRQRGGGRDVAGSEASATSKRRGS